MSIENCSNCGNKLSICCCGEPETFNKHNPHCPYCGCENDDDDPNPEYYEDGYFELDCSDCGKTFNVNVYVSYSYTCSRVKND